MATFSDLVNEVKLKLLGFATDKDRLTYLTAAMLSTDTTATVDDASQTSLGLIEIDDELLWIKAIDSSTKTLTFSPFGRGFAGTTAAAHAQNAMVLDNPKWPRSQIKQAINDTIQAVYPDLFKVVKTTFTFVGGQMTYQLPTDVGEVLQVTWDAVGPSQRWVPINRYDYDTTANTTDFANGKSITLFQSPVPGRTVQVVYTAPPNSLVNNSDVFNTVTGLDDSTRDVIAYGACYRLVGYSEVARLQQASAESAERADLVPPGAAANASRFFYSLYKSRLDEEKMNLLRIYPSYTHYTR